MATTKIEWTERTWNPIGGCRKVSPGCANCYAIRQAHRMAGHPNTKIATRYKGLTQIEGGKLNWTGSTSLHVRVLEEPLQRKKPTTYFISLSDLFYDGRPESDIERVLDVMELAEWHTFQILTKYASRMELMLNKRYGMSDPPPNIWFGVSIENQEQADLRIPALLWTPAAYRFVSCEPLLGPVDLSRWMDDGPDWVIVGGESGTGARPMHPDWARSLHGQCKKARVPFFFKQWGEWLPEAQIGADGDAPSVGHPDCRNWGVLNHEGEFFATAAKWEDLPVGCVDASECYVYRLGKRNTGRLLDGRTWDEIPGV